MNIHSAISGVAVLAALASSVDAQSIWVPNSLDATTEGSSSTGYPWDRDGSTATSNDIRVQYIYDSSNFSTLTGPVLLTGVNFRANATSSSWTGGSYANVEVFVGTAAIDYTALASGSSFDASYVGGVKPAAAYTGSVAVVGGTGNGTGTPAPVYVSISFASPILYDPTTGDDLVLEMAHDGNWAEAGGAASGGAFASDAASTLSRRMYDLSDWTSTTSSGASNTGIAAEFTYNPPAGIFASFSADLTEAGPGELVTFTNTSFTSDPGGFTAVDWDLDGDGLFETSGSPVSASFASCGANNISLRVTDATNGSDTVTDVGVTIAAPAASFTAAPQNVGVPLTVQFTDMSTNAPTSWDWDLDGDGVFGDSTLQNPQWVYTTQNVFTVSLNATNACGTTNVTNVIDTRQLLCTQFGGTAGWTGGSAFYVDVDVLNAAGLTITSVDVQIQNAGVVGDLEVWVKPGTHVGNENDRTLWTKVSEGSFVGAGSPNPTSVDIVDFSLAQGLYGFAFVYDMDSGERFNYSTGGATNASNLDLTLSNGAMHSPAFVGTTTFAPRNWNGCIAYDIGMGAGQAQTLGGGCANSTGATAELNPEAGVAKTGASVTFMLNGAPASASLGVVFVGFSSIGGVDLGVIGAPGCLLFPSAVASPAIATDANGDASLTLNIGALPAGIPFYLQAAVADIGHNPLGVILSNGLENTVGN